MNEKMVELKNGAAEFLGLIDQGFSMYHFGGMKDERRDEWVNIKCLRWMKDEGRDELVNIKCLR